MKGKIKFYLTLLMIIIIAWISINSLIQSIKCPKMTQTEIFLNIPKSSLLNYKVCK